MSLNQLLPENAWHGVKLGSARLERVFAQHCVHRGTGGKGLLFHLILNAYWKPLDFELPRGPSQAKTHGVAGSTQPSTPRTTSSSGRQPIGFGLCLPGRGALCGFAFCESLGRKSVTGTKLRGQQRQKTGVLLRNLEPVTDFGRCAANRAADRYVAILTRKDNILAAVRKKFTKIDPSPNKIDNFGLVLLSSLP